MHIQEKRAWFAVAVFFLTLIALLISGLLIGFRWAALGALAVFGLSAFGSLIGVKESWGKKSLLDERDLAIQQKATIIGFSTCWGLFVICSAVLPILLWRGYDRPVTLPAMFFPMMVIWGLVLFFTVQALSIIVIYRKVGPNDFTVKNDTLTRKRRKILLGLTSITAVVVAGLLLFYVFRWYGGVPEGKTADFQAAVRAIAAREGPPLTLRSPKELEIISARYGAQDTWREVTEPVRQKVKDHTLNLLVSNDIAGDPLFGVVKTLWVEYRLDGQQRTASVREGNMLQIPKDPTSVTQVITTPERLVALAKACPAEVGFYGKNLTTGKVVAYRPDQPACLASIVKIFVLLEVMRQAEAGTLDLTEPITLKGEQGEENTTITRALDKMIGWSDNAATDALAKRVGYEAVNALPEQLGITGLSDQILPAPGVLAKVLDERIYHPGLVKALDLPPQHGTARAIVRYFELLHRGKLLNGAISQKVQEVFDRNPVYFAPDATPADFISGGKGGSLVWLRPGHRPYNMIGWGNMIKNDKIALAYCLWTEWFPKQMSEAEQLQWCHGLSDGVVNVLLQPESGQNQ